MLYFLHLLLNSPNLIQISAKESGRFPFEETNLDFWEKECPSDFTFKQLKIVNISEVCGRPQEMEFLKFVLCRSPVLEVMNICPSRYVALLPDHRIDILIELLQFRRASAKAEIKFISS